MMPASPIQHALQWLLLKKIAFDELTQLERQARHPKEIQIETFKRILNRLASTRNGKALGLHNIRSYSDFGNSVPITTYDCYREAIERDLDTGTASLTPEQPKLYARTSGTTSKSKFIPVTDWTLELAKRAQRISAHAYARDIPGAFAGKILAITSSIHEGETKAGVPIGAMSGVVSDSMPSILSAMYILPRWVLELEDYELKYKVIAALAMRENSLSLFASANPTTFLRIFEITEQFESQLIEVVRTGDLALLDSRLKAQYSPLPARADALSRILSAKPERRASAIWPGLRAIITWMSGNCSMALSRVLKSCDRRVRVAEMGYLSSEFRGTITVDCGQLGGLPPLGDTFFEFIEEERWDFGVRETKLLHELEPGRRYQIIATTGDGLVRYQINDLIEVTGRFYNTPLIRFLQKGKGVTNLTGEKLCEFHVLNAFSEIAESKGLTVPFFHVLADKDEMRYRLILEGTGRWSGVEQDMLATDFESRIAEINIEYAEKRKSGRLKSLCCELLTSGLEEFIRRMKIAEGQRESQLKIARLEYSGGSNDILTRKFLEES